MTKRMPVHERREILAQLEEDPYQFEHLLVVRSLEGHEEWFMQHPLQERIEGPFWLFGCHLLDDVMNTPSGAVSLLTNTIYQVIQTEDAISYEEVGPYDPEAA